jgi:hypothetical protein
LFFHHLRRPFCIRRLPGVSTWKWSSSWKFHCQTIIKHRSSVQKLKKLTKNVTQEKQKTFKGN